MTAARDEQVPGLAGATVLLVEDEAVVALDLALVLGDLGCVVLGPAVDSIQALALLRPRGAPPGIAPGPWPVNAASSAGMLRGTAATAGRDHLRVWAEPLTVFGFVVLALLLRAPALLYSVINFD